ncbi:ExbD/TolR family protein [Halorhodospira neutriphila]|uniref:Biopolymer transport protein ExbD n=1 Tax=Halorhodospira neutriphila TaxID=168379 RepID=A0ABS1E296_9GAMM|nr:biopolymer transporter ExbD [Halorhodospira neutriphila]MBK1725910.1 hypothetical protein [Halorhodospira neutriphila]
MRRFDQINVIPFIDIMLVLLAIVLTTATFIAEGRLEIDLPEASSTAEPPADPPVEVAIGADRQLFYGGEPVALAELKGRLDGLAPETAVTLRVDRAVPFGRFVTVVDALKARGLTRLAIVTREGEGG